MQSILLTSKFTEQLSTPILSTLLANPPTRLAIIGGVALHSGLVMAGLPSWQCPILYGLGVPCPGCGLSRATAALLQGDWETSLTYHAFAPLFLIAFGLIVVATLLPSVPQTRFIQWVERVESYTGVTPILLILFVFYWLARLIFLRQSFINLIMG